jgi:hypothetical protein
MRSIEIAQYFKQGILCYPKGSNMEPRELAAGLLEALFSQSDSPTAL